MNIVLNMMKITMNDKMKSKAELKPPLKRTTTINPRSFLTLSFKFLAFWIVFTLSTTPMLQIMVVAMTQVPRKLSTYPMITLARTRRITHIIYANFRIRSKIGISASKGLSRYRQGTDTAHVYIRPGVVLSEDLTKIMR